MTIFSSLLVIWCMSSLLTPYLALYCLDKLAYLVDINYVPPHNIYDKLTHELTQPTHIFEYIVSYQYIIPISLSLGPFAIILSFGHIIFSVICFFPYYLHRQYLLKHPIIQAEELLQRF